MKLLVSDYDGTIEIEELFKDPYIPKGTISNIHDFRSAGNKFMIATARPYDSIMSEIKEYHIPYDFVSTLNGCIIHGNNGNIINSMDMPDFEVLRNCNKKVKSLNEAFKYINKKK